MPSDSEIDLIKYLSVQQGAKITYKVSPAWVEMAKPLDHHLVPSLAAGFPKKSRTSVQKL